MTIYQITKEQTQVSKLTHNFTSAKKEKEALYNEIITHDREPVEMYRFESFDEAKKQFSKIKDGFAADDQVTLGSYNNFTTASFTVYELVEWTADEDGEITEGGDVWDWFIV